MNGLEVEVEVEEGRRRRRGEAGRRRFIRLPQRRKVAASVDRGESGLGARSGTRGNDAGAVFVTPDLHVNCCGGGCGGGCGGCGGGGGGGARQIISVPNCLLCSTVVSTGDFSRRLSPALGVDHSRSRREGRREEAWITSPSLTHSLTHSSNKWNTRRRRS